MRFRRRRAGNPRVWSESPRKFKGYTGTPIPPDAKPPPGPAASVPDREIAED